jgi:hypothetical protein
VTAPEDEKNSRSAVQDELIKFLSGMKNSDVVNRKVLRDHMERIFGHESVPSTPQRSERRGRAHATNGTRSTRRLNYVLRRLERAGILERVETKNGSYVMVKDANQIALLKLGRTVPHAGSEEHPPELQDQGDRAIIDDADQHQEGRPGTAASGGCVQVP